jgi:hypothetical protein
MGDSRYTQLLNEPLLRLRSLLFSPRCEGTLSDRPRAHVNSHTECCRGNRAPTRGRRHHAFLFPQAFLFSASSDPIFRSDRSLSSTCELAHRCVRVWTRKFTNTREQQGSDGDDTRASNKATGKVDEEGQGDEQS